jgi:hypothetical protein
VIEAMQLDCSQPIGDYAGYSGSPIERSGPPERRKLLGVLLEQYPEQLVDHRAPQRASTVLFAATMSEVFRRFDCFGADHLIMEIAPRPSAAPGAPQDRYSRIGARSAEDQISRASSLIRALDDLSKSDSLEGIDVNVLKLDVINKLISNVMDGTEAR